MLRRAPTTRTYAIARPQRRRTRRGSEWKALVLAIDDAYAVIARLFGTGGDEGRYGRRLKTLVHIVNVDRRGDGGVFAFARARHDVRRLSLAAALDRLKFLT